MSDGPPDPHAVLPEYDLGVVEHIVPAGGTAGRTWRVSSSTGEYLLRLRGVRTSDAARLRFDHGLRAHLVTRGVPTVCAVAARDGVRWVRRAGRVYEVYPFVVGRPLCPGNAIEVVRAAESLARFHRAAQSYRPPMADRQIVAQFTTLGYSDHVSDRLDDPCLQLVNLSRVRDLAPTGRDRLVVDRCIARVQALQQTYAGPSYERLAGYVIHGDYTPANLLYSEQGEVVGIFDLDWAMYGARCLDVAYGLCFFCTEPRQIDTSSIWSLTDAVGLSAERCVAFLAGYHRTWPLRGDEIEAIPSALASLWLSKRLEGMAKVGGDERFLFFARDVERPLLWMDEHWSHLRSAAFA